MPSRRRSVFLYTLQQWHSRTIAAPFNPESVLTVDLAGAGHTSAGKKFGCAFGGRLPGMKMVERIPQTPSVTLHLDQPPISDIEHENHEHDYQDTSTHSCQKSGR
jgi:hypothetical protein